MRLICSVASAAMVTSFTGCTVAMPWSVPQEHFEVLSLRHATPLNLDSVTDVECLDTESHIVYHDQNAAQLAICDGISGASNTRCRGATATTSGVRGSANFTLAALAHGATITLTKTRWEECVHAAREKCPTGSLRGVCRRGASAAGDVEFRLESTMYAVE